MNIAGAMANAMIKTQCAESAPEQARHSATYKIAALIATYFRD
ncbi:hypothetical protein CFter6_4931 [Collimonas fungivorans]|uniref:Uncharacterized protein n=1 Tax=Collimonas fungivorans TaxID=158899 RepID=A0A127PIG6_9BURK|nr:hypothetical protein CFter6_4931 [Collimonas fungivorans]